MMRQIARCRAYPKQTPALRACLGLRSREGVFQPMCSDHGHGINLVLKLVKCKVAAIARKTAGCECPLQLGAA
jgi:hypothetical protein